MTHRQPSVWYWEKDSHCLPVPGWVLSRHVYTGFFCSNPSFHVVIKHDSALIPWHGILHCSGISGQNTSWVVCLGQLLLLVWLQMFKINPRWLKSSVSTRYAGKWEFLQSKVLCYSNHAAFFLFLCEKELERQKFIYTKGCVGQFEKWLQDNLIFVAGIFVGIALLQVTSFQHSLWITSGSFDFCVCF